ncbi:phosphogluconate dehydratase [Devosia sp. XJ19-1]|uniref:Phosphogluconate dehydratase n=1 Tax=Devosia ureilytica TaxID=2952754 RepID=A0A9Q4AR08_9HYPH|nr:phosphogluconate dehydratase [Devosia ureilytica]MCP8884922.1 phosphogluconate dehydratase [Devosia ureilytica]MCP8888567.1 phosphogluconate dehydratase [Devosia ureilytica]
MTVRQAIQDVTDRIAARSGDSRRDYLNRLDAAKEQGVYRSALSCGNLAHGFAACSPSEKAALAGNKTLNLGIINSYNDMLSAHQPYQFYPEIIKQAAREIGATAQVAGGVPAMCDGVTQGQPGMDLSLFSRDVIAMATAISLSHNMFDAAVYLGICDKIVPGLVIGALSFGHLPAVFIPAGPMPSGLPNDEKSKVRQLYMEGKVGRAELLEAESKSYHSAGTCTFYGTANSNQMLMEIMGLHLPGASFVNPGTPLRDALTREATKRALSLTALGNNYTPIGHIMDEKAIVNGLVGLHATGGSTNHTMHLIAMAAAAGLQVTWDDMSDLSDATPLLARVYPNGVADVNHFHAAGGMGFLIKELLNDGYLHEDVKTVWGAGLSNYTVEAKLIEDALSFEQAPEESALPKVLTSTKTPFQPTGGLKLLKGNLGRSVIKVSAVKPEHRVVEAPARVFHGQEGLQAAFKAGELTGDMIAVVRFSGPGAIGMPELHKLTPALGVLQDRGFKVALLTDGRMSGASGKVPAAIHMTPEAMNGGPISKIRDGDMIRLDANEGTLTFLGDEKEFFSRTPATEDLRSQHFGMGRELFAGFRSLVGVADKGASVFN